MGNVPGRPPSTYVYSLTKVFKVGCRYELLHGLFLSAEMAGASDRRQRMALVAGSSRERAPAPHATLIGCALDPAHFMERTSWPKSRADLPSSPPSVRPQRQSTPQPA